MALIKEDGSIVSGANSYITRAELIAYAVARGVTLADTDATDVLAIKAMDYLTMFDAKWRGSLVSPGVQALAWPRKGAIPMGSTSEFPDNAIPGNIIKSQYELALVASTGIDLLPTTNPATGFVTREKVDVIETEYSEAVALETFGQLPKIPLVDALLAPWLAGGSMTLTTRRV